MVRWLRILFGKRPARIGNAPTEQADADTPVDDALLRRCFITGDVILQLNGQTIKLDSYELEPGDRALEADAFGECYLSALAASPWGTHWAERSAKHLEQTGLTALGRRGDWVAYEYPNTAEVELIRDDGLQLHLRQDLPMRDVQGGVLAADRPHEATFRVPVAQRAEMAELHAKMLRDQSISAYDFYKMFGLAHRLRASEYAAQDRLLFDEELQPYWTPTAVTVMVAQSIFVPEDAAGYLR